MEYLIFPKENKNNTKKSGIQPTGYCPTACYGLGGHPCGSNCPSYAINCRYPVKPGMSVQNV